MFKARRNPLAGGDVDLILTGDFINSAFHKHVGQGRYLFGFRDWKTPDLFDRYNKGRSGRQDLRSLNQNTFNTFLVNKIKQPFITNIKQQIGQR